jgi:putative transposase
MVSETRFAYGVSERRACQALGYPRSSQRYQSVGKDRGELRVRLRDLAAVRVRYGYRRLHVLLRREGYRVNHKLVYRLYCEEGLTMRTKRRRRHRSGQIRTERSPATRPSERWSMDFMAEQLYDGRRLRVLTLVDNFSRESLALRVGQRFTGDDVVAVVEEVAAQRGVPKTIQVDNGPEFISKSVDLWAWSHGVELDFSRPGKPTDNALIESFNGKFREACLNQHWFQSLEEARERIEAWRRQYNEERPHRALGGKTPREFLAERCRACPAPLG